MSDLQEVRKLIYAILAGHEEGSLDCSNLNAARAIYHICKASKLLGFEIEEADQYFYKLFPHNTYWVINTKPFALFGVSLKAYERLVQLGYKGTLSEGKHCQENDEDYLYCREINRTDPLLVQLMHELGPDELSNNNSLKLLEVPAFLEVSILVYMNGAEMLTDGKIFWY